MSRHLSATYIPSFLSLVQTSSPIKPLPKLLQESSVKTIGAQCYTELPWTLHPPPFLLLRMDLYARLLQHVLSACRLTQLGQSQHCKQLKSDPHLISQLLPQTSLLCHKG